MSPHVNSQQKMTLGYILLVLMEEECKKYNKLFFITGTDADAHSSFMNMKPLGEPSPHPPASDQGNCPSLSQMSAQPWVTRVIVESHCPLLCRVWSWTSLMASPGSFLEMQVPQLDLQIPTASGLTGAGELSGCFLHRHKHTHTHTSTCTRTSTHLDCGVVLGKPELYSTLSLVSRAGPDTFTFSMRTCLESEW